MAIILVLAEQREGTLHPQTTETIAAAQALAAERGGDVVVAIFGASGAGAAEALSGAAIARLLLVPHDALEPHNPDALCVAAAGIIDELDPDVVLLPHTYQARDYAPRLAARYRRALISDCTAFRHDGGQTVFVRQVLQGKVNAEVVAEGATPHFVSLQGGTFHAEDLRGGDAPAAETMNVDIDAGNMRVRSEAPVQGAEKTVDLSAAEIIVSVGRGIEAADNVDIASKLASALGGELGGSRPVCDAEWLPIERQIGSSGQTVAPKLYLALGISGSIQHMMGVKGAQTVIAINKDAHAPIFKVADFGIVGNVLEVVPAILEVLGES
jgi:electron transfer flavoprotein alpha subunit